ncbi:MAG: helix-turn-helix domain-containing protein [Pseudonocardia sp.]|nr:helix-turn-helix domain-containing protein [Pseudonocardia sp.]
MEGPPTSAKRLLSTTAAARELGVNQTTLSRWARSGVVQPAQRTIGGHMRWDLDQLRADLQAAGAILTTGQRSSPDKS